MDETQRLTIQMKEAAKFFLLFQFIIFFKVTTNR